LREVQKARVVGRGAYGKEDISISATLLMVILTDLQMDVPAILITLSISKSSGMNFNGGLNDEKAS